MKHLGDSTPSVKRGITDARSRQPGRQRPSTAMTKSGMIQPVGTGTHVATTQADAAIRRNVVLDTAPLSSSALTTSTQAGSQSGTHTGGLSSASGASGRAIDPMLADALTTVRAVLRTQLGDKAMSHWFGATEFDSFVDGRLTVTVPTKFLQNWVQRNYSHQLMTACQGVFENLSAVDVVLRQPKPQIEPQMQRTALLGSPALSNASSGSAVASNGAAANHQSGGHLATGPSHGGLSHNVRDRGPTIGYAPRADQSLPGLHRTHAAGIDGSPLEARCTFDSFIVGAPNRVAHAAATQVAETLGSEMRAFNPVYLHAPVGLGKSHLLQAMAWETKRRFPQANLIYMTAERFRYDFIDALKSKSAPEFKEKFRNLDILIIDDLEFMAGEKTEQEFDHIVNALLDSGRQIVVSASRPPALLEGMNERLRSRLSRGLIVELGLLDDELRLKVLERRMQEKRQYDPSFEVPRAVLQLLAERLVENGRELEGAINSLFAKWTVLRQPLTIEMAEGLLRDMVLGSGDQIRIKIEDILRVVTRHFGVSKQDIISERRHRSIVWPRQIGMYLAKQMTSRSLPEIGRRFGDRDHTTVLHAIRKVDREMTGNARLIDEIEELKRQLRR